MGRKSAFNLIDCDCESPSSKGFMLIGANYRATSFCEFCVANSVPKYDTRHCRIHYKGTKAINQFKLRVMFYNLRFHHHRYSMALTEASTALSAKQCRFSGFRDSICTTQCRP